VLPESLVIMEYLEERFPEPALWPVDPAERALGRLWLDRFDVRLGGDYYALRRGDQSQLDERLRDLDAALEAQPFLSGRAYGLGESLDDWAASLLDEQDGELVLVGASLGGYAALAMTSRAPERVRALALIGARAEGDSPERRAGRADTIALIENGGAEALWE